MKHFLYMPMTGLGLYGGHRGNRWLRNRIKIFKQFVMPSLLEQTNQDFVLWVSWRWEERGDFTVKEFEQYLQGQLGNDRVVFTYSGVCFWDDKYPDDEAYSRLINALHGAIGELINYMGEADEILMTIQPSDDIYRVDAVDTIQKFFKSDKKTQVFGFSCGFVMDYLTKRIRFWTPTTTPPFYTIRFPRETFIDPFKHAKYTGPYKSHEYVKDYLPAKYVNDRGFMVGTHGENISTVFDHPFAQDLPDNSEGIESSFALTGVEPLKLPFSLRKKIMRHLPHAWRRKLRYIFGEKFAAKLYAWIRN